VKPDDIVELPDGRRLMVISPERAAQIYKDVQIRNCSMKKRNPYGCVRCGWCGRTVALSNKKLAMPHMNGAQRCVGAGQPHASHLFLLRSHAEHRNSKYLPKS